MNNFDLSKIKSEDDLKELFIEKWNWDVPAISSIYFDYPDTLRNKLEKAIILGEKLDYKIFFFSLRDVEKWEKESKAIERKIISQSNLKELISNSIFIFSTSNFKYLDFVKAEKIGKNIQIKRFSITPDNRNKLRTPSEQLEKLKLIPEKVSSSYIKNQIEEAFSVEVVTDKFYREYIDIFEKIKKVLITQRLEIPESEKIEKLRNFIHQVLNRIMFLYFVQKRGCFGNDKNFLANFWDNYKENKRKSEGQNRFHKEWLNVLFFESLSRPSWLYSYKHYLGEYNQILKTAPYLNGGLFEEDELDKIGWEIPDELFDDIFEFFESYNFTVEESTPFDIDIAINPEMLGNIYEHLVNIEEEEEQAKAGIFYTPKVEIDFMIRRALVEFIYNKTKIKKEKLYEFIFPKIGEEIKDPFTFEEAKKVLEELDEIFILDPACGSGHYLVVALQILYQLKEVLWEKLQISHLGKYHEKKRIIERNIYGNDIKEWAVNVSKLRLWLDLFVDAEEEILKNQKEPLLPNLNFKIRCGDSLVQRIGNELIPLRRIRNFIGSRREDLKNLIQKKEYVYKTSDLKEFKNALYLEKKLLQNALSQEITKIQKDIQAINYKLTNIHLNKNKFDLFGKILKKKENTLFGGELEELLKKQLKERKEYLETTLNNIKKIKEELEKQKEPPLLWDLAFAEVFQIKKGFDIVIANPPYVRQEKIEDLTGFYSKGEYKEKLIQQIFLDWSYNFDGKPISPPFSKEKFDKKSDLYVYFYFKGLKLLNPDGILCYISSNSWLDVGYGVKMQEIFLKRVPIIAIYDNQARRSFKHADVNTIIVLMKAPKDKDFDEEIKQNEVQFVMFKKPFEEVMYSEIFIELEDKKDLKQFTEGKRRENDIYRLHIVNQEELYEIGKNYESSFNKEKEQNKNYLFGSKKSNGNYEGNKWGGKYLRAPEIYWKILEKGKDKLVRLRDIAEVRFGIKTGANEFFYLKPVGMTLKEIVEIAEKNPDALIRVKNGAGWEGEIEAEFLRPVIKSLKELKRIQKNDSFEFLVLVCNKDIKKIKNKEVFNYIKWGESNNYNLNPTCKNRKKWYFLNLQEFGDFIFSMTYGDRYLTPINEKTNIDAAIYNVYIKHEYKNYLDWFKIFFNSSIFPLFIEIYSRVMTGALPLAQMKVYEWLLIDVYLPSLDYYSKIYNIYTSLSIFNRNIYDIFTELGFDPNKPIREQEPNPLPDRKALDDVVFDAFGLTEEERKEVYYAVAELVKNRLEKAKSV